MAFSDNFTGTAGQKLSARTGWSLLVGTDDFQIGTGATANQLVRSTGTSTVAFYGTGNDSTTAQTVTADIGASDNPGVVVLGNADTGATFTGYVLKFHTGNSVRLWRYNLSVGALLATVGSISDGLALELDVTLVAGNPSFTMKHGGATLGTFTDSSASKVVSGQRGVCLTATGTITPAFDNYSDNFTPPVSAAFTLTEPFSGFVFEGLRQTSDPSIAVSWTGAPGNVQARIVNSIGGAAVSGFDWATQVSSPAANSSATLTFPGLPVGGYYRVQVRDTVTTAEADGLNDWSVGAVIPIWGRSQAAKLFSNGGTLAPTSGSRVSVVQNGTTPGSITTAQLSAGQGAESEGVVAIANDWQADTSNVPAMIVAVAFPGLAITDFIGDTSLSLTVSGVTGTFTSEAITSSDGKTANVTVSGSTLTLTNAGHFTAGTTITGGTSGATATVATVWNVWTGHVTNAMNAAKNQASGFAYYMADTGDGGALDAAYSADLDTIKTMFDALTPGQIPLYGIVPHMRANNGLFTFTLRQIMFDKANSGGSYRLLTFVNDIVLAADGDPHQAVGAFGNQRAGTRIGRGLAWLLSNSSLSRVGPQIASAAFTNGSKNVIEVTFDRAIHTPDSSTTGIQGVHVSTDSGSTFPDPGAVGFSTAITASNKIQITKASGSWTSGVTRIDFMRGIPFTSTAGATFAGPESTVEANYLDKMIYDTTTFESSRGLPWSPVMGTGFGVSDASSGAGTPAWSKLSLSMSSGL